MKSKLKYVFLLLLIGFISCTNKNKSLDFYFIDSENKENFLLLDLSQNLLEINPKIEDSTKEILKPIKKINLLALKKTEGNTIQFDNEYEKIVNILKQDKYQELTRVKDKKFSAKIKYVGNDNNIKEVVMLAKQTGTIFFIARLLGDNLKMEDVAKIANELPNLKNLNLELDKLQEFVK
jgi:hypothetical protein